jgi:RNA polymerase sigma-70 factor (ECF subfamily)
MASSGGTDLTRKFLEQRDGLLGFILALTHDREAAEEIFQETGLVIVQEAGRGTRVEQFLPWAHEIARRRVAEYFRKNARRSSMELSVDVDEAVALAFEENAADPVVLQQSRRHLEDCLEGLSKDQKTLLDRRYRDRSPLRDIARETDSTEGSVKVLLWRVRRQLARCIEGKISAAEEGR